MKEILQVLKAEKEDRIIMGFIMGGLWLLVTLVVAIVALVSKNPEELGMIPVATITVILMIAGFKYFNFNGFLRDYHLAVIMGKTRKIFLKAHMIGEIITLVIAFVAVFALYHLELFVHAQLGIVKYEIRIDRFFHPYYLIGIIAILSVETMFVAAMASLKYWVPFTVWIFGCVGMSKIGGIIEDMEAKSGMISRIVQKFERFPQYGISLILIATTFVLWGISRKILLSKDV